MSAKRRPADPAPRPAASPRDPTTGRFAGAPDPAREAAAADTLAEVAALSRTPFRRILSHYIQAAPDLEALAAQADRYPDRWAQGLAIVARVAGYTEKLEIEGSVDIHHIHQLSDLELECELERLQAQLNALPPRLRSLPPGPLPERPA